MQVKPSCWLLPVCAIASMTGRAVNARMRSSQAAENRFHARPRSPFRLSPSSPFSANLHAAGSCSQQLMRAALRTRRRTTLGAKATYVFPLNSLPGQATARPQGTLGQLSFSVNLWKLNAPMGKLGGHKCRKRLWRIGFVLRHTTSRALCC